MTWPCLQRRGSPCEGLAPANRTAGAGGLASCSLLVTTPALQTEAYEKQVTACAQSVALQPHWTLNILKYEWIHYVTHFIKASSFKNHAIFSCLRQSARNPCLLLCINTDSWVITGIGFTSKGFPVTTSYIFPYVWNIPWINWINRAVCISNVFP